MKIKLLIAAMLLNLTGTAALAQVVDSGWYVAPTVSVVINDKSRAKDVGVGAGLVLGKYLNEQWNIEVGAQYLQLDGTRDEQGHVGVDALYFFKRNPNFAPYATVGLGFVRESAGNNDLMVKAGFGFTKKISQSLDFRADVRYQWHDNKNAPSSLGDTVISAGLINHF